MGLLQYLQPPPDQAAPQHPLVAALGNMPPPPDRKPNPMQRMGMLHPGNIDLLHRPQVKNADGSISTVRSMSFHDEDTGAEVLVPTVSEDGRIMEDQEAVDQYYKTGRHLGIFDTPDNATSFAERLHQQQEQYYLGGKKR